MAASKNKERSTVTPARRQYLNLKKQHPGVILFYRMGDFYETFDGDAELIAEVLDIALTSREMGQGNRIPMAGIPHHAVDNYVGKLLSAGYKVAIADQISEPSSKGIVERAVTGVLTPGTVTNPTLLRGDQNSFVAAIISEEHRAGIAFADITTGEFACATVSAQDGDLLDQLRREIGRIGPLEVVAREEDPARTILNDQIVISTVPNVAWRLDDATETLQEHFGIPSLEPFGCDDQPLAARAAGALLTYFQRTNFSNLRQITNLFTYSTDQYMSLDAQTRRNLEIEESTGHSDSPSLFDVINATRTPVGARRLRQWLNQPLLIRVQIEQRYDAIEWWISDAIRRGEARSILSGVSDLERVINRVVNHQAGPREIRRLGDSLAKLPAICEVLDQPDRPDLLQLPPICSEAADEIARALVDDPAPGVGSGDVIRPGFEPELDSLRKTLHEDREYIANLEAREKQATGIERMKVGYNKVFGYFLEISNANRKPVPEHYIRKQTLVNAERYITPELKEAEQRVSAAEERIAAAEQAAYDRLVSEVAFHADAIRHANEAVAIADVTAGLAEIAALRGYTRPEIVETGQLDVIGCRHPIVELSMPSGQFVANDVQLGGDDGQIAIITGPNMAGKSTYLRQAALLVLLAQIGSFVPAERMRFSIVDRIFTRIGAQDDLASGQSTFMVEMLEAATILNHATPRSLVILDEIGRGTSTYDGLAIATAIVEYLHNTDRLGCKTLFATHYHEITALADILPRVRNYRVDVQESGSSITFLYRVVPGGADRSYGVYVAQLAGLPQGVIRRAESILSELERDGAALNHRERATTAITNQPLQLAFFDGTHPVLDRLAELEVEAMSPLEALTRLYELQSMLDETKSS